ncbi:hypothetical protein DY218_21555 [Streptomyces triticagri]|uniref:Uncharacterized protein n=1 Tax=Streptomyces triticagri TaxID=2293568 RepID=A0A372M292_9ACTN|nr:hypothetical protein [Streptomyces triticagri]RFU84635.1 hypothetical protein DY218_21555 [Streptomyces triticagri]
MGQYHAHDDEEFAKPQVSRHANGRPWREPRRIAILSPLPERPRRERQVVRLLGFVISAASWPLALPDASFTGASLSDTEQSNSLTGFAVCGVLFMCLAYYFGHRGQIAWSVLLIAGPPSAYWLLGQVTAAAAGRNDDWPMASAIGVVMICWLCVDTAGLAHLSRLYRVCRRDRHQPAVCVYCRRVKR